MAEKRVSVRFGSEGGNRLKAEFRGIGEAGAKGMARIRKEMALVNARLAALGRRLGRLFRVAGLVVLRGALIRTGIGALIVGAGELVYQFTRLVSGAGGFGEAMSLLKDVAVEVWERIRMGAAAAGAAATAMFFDLKADAASGMQSAIESVVGFGNTAANTFEGAYEAIKTIWGLLPAAIGDLAFQAANSLVDGVEAMLNGVVSRINGFIGGINQGLEALGSERRISLVPDLDLGEIENRFEGAASAATTAAQTAFDRAFEDNPLTAPDLGLTEAANRALESANLYRGAARDLADGARAPLENWQALRDAVRGTDEASADALTEATGAADRLETDLLWSVYAAADQIGLGSRYRPLAAALLSRDRLPVAVSTAMLQALHRHGGPDWQAVALSLVDRIDPAERWLYLLHMRELAEGAEVALAARRWDRGSTTPTATPILGRLLREVGKIPLAARYLRRARRTWPWQPSVTRYYLYCLIDLGQIDAARAVIAETVPATGPVSPVIADSAALVLLRAGDAAAAAALAARAGLPQRRGNLHHQLLRAHLRRGATDEAEALVEAVRGALPVRSALHFGPGLDGTVLADLRLAARAEGATDVRSLVPAAGAVLDRWLSDPPDGSAGAQSRVPRQVLQYWDKTVPPDDIVAIMRTWQDLPGIAYVRFDRRTALDWLDARLDQSWQQALRAARAPAQQSDFFRLAWLMLEGGFYVNSDDRRTGDLSAVFEKVRGLTVLCEPHGSIANNILFAPPRHPAIVWAAHAARRALLERHNDNTWMKTGPGLMTRAVAWYVSDGPDSPPDLTILRKWAVGRWGQSHVPLPYKRTTSYWNTDAIGAGRLRDLLDCARAGRAAPPT